MEDEAKQRARDLIECQKDRGYERKKCWSSDCDSVLFYCDGADVFGKWNLTCAKCGRWLHPTRGERPDTTELRRLLKWAYEQIPSQEYMVFCRWHSPPLRTSPEMVRIREIVTEDK